MSIENRDHVRRLERRDDHVWRLEYRDGHVGMNDWKCVVCGLYIQEMGPPDSAGPVSSPTIIGPCPNNHTK